MANQSNLDDRYCRLTPEGWVFLIILCFIGIGAVLRNVNLLILATGILVVPLIFNWRVCVANLRSISAKRVVPERVHALTPINVAWTCENIGGRITARNLVLRDRLTDDRKTQAESAATPSKTRALLERADALFRGTIDDSCAHICFQAVSTADPDIVTYQCHFPFRGKYQLGPADLQTSFPFGLVASWIGIENSETVYVAPPLGQLHPTWEQRINSMDTGGQSRMRRRGLEHDEFYAMRKWRSGDNQKDIHWRSTARRGFPMVKQYDEPNDRDFAMLLDLFSGDENSRIQCEAILSFAATALEQTSSNIHGRFALAVCGDESKHISGRYNPVTRKTAMHYLAMAQAGDATELDLALTELASQVSLGTPLYCFSTRPIPAMLDSGHLGEASPALKAIQHLIRWVPVDSLEFNELFSPQTSASSMSNKEATA